MQNFRNLVVWQRAQTLAARVHLVTERTPGGASGAWRTQLRRSAQSIGANIAEGTMRGTAKQFAHFLEIALGSASETESHLDFAARIGALTPEDALQFLDEIGQLQRMLVTLRKRVMEADKRKHT
jgi:four helix bundle protein